MMALNPHPDSLDKHDTSLAMPGAVLVAENGGLTEVGGAVHQLVDPSIIDGDDAETGETEIGTKRNREETTT